MPSPLRCFLEFAYAFRLSASIRKEAREHPCCVLIYMNSYIFQIYFSSSIFLVKHISNMLFYMFDVIIGRTTWSSQIRTHIYTKIHTHKNNKRGGVEGGG